MEETIAAAESIKVPSQSNTTKSNCCGIFLFIYFNKSSKLRRQRRMQFKAFFGKRMAQFQRRCVQEHALQTVAHQAAVQLEIAIFFVAQNGIAQMGQMDSDLVRASRIEDGAEQGVRTCRLHEFEPCARSNAGSLIDPHPALPLRSQILIQRK